jgi:23S rRNA (uracil1939-C5)-methyltransferase
MHYHDNLPIEIHECHLPMPEIQELRARIDLPAGSPIEQTSLRLGTSGDPMIIFHGDMRQITELSIDFPASVIWQDGDTWRVLAGESSLTYEVADQTFIVSPPSFFQVNTSILPSLVEETFKTLRLEPGMTLFDLYAGVGLFSAFAASTGVQVYAVEESPAACADFEQNLDRFDEVVLYEAPVELALPAIEADADVLLIDPPRSGLSRAALDAIIEHSPSRLVYLSCDLGTLARDAKRLTAGGYHLEQITPLDLFPQTFHIESLSSWTRT